MHILIPIFQQIVLFVSILSIEHILSSREVAKVFAKTYFLITTFDDKFKTFYTIVILEGIASLVIGFLYCDFPARFIQIVSLCLWTIYLLKFCNNNFAVIVNHVSRLFNLDINTRLQIHFLHFFAEFIAHFIWTRPESNIKKKYRLIQIITINLLFCVIFCCFGVRVTSIILIMVAKTICYRLKEYSFITMIVNQIIFAIFDVVEMIFHKAMLVNLQ